MIKQLTRKTFLFFGLFKLNIKIFEQICKILFFISSFLFLINYFIVFLKSESLIWKRVMCVYFFLKQLFNFWLYSSISILPFHRYLKPVYFQRISLLFLFSSLNYVISFMLLSFWDRIYRLNWNSEIHLKPVNYFENNTFRIPCFEGPLINLIYCVEWAMVFLFRERYQLQQLILKETILGDIRKQESQKERQDLDLSFQNNQWRLDRFNKRYKHDKDLYQNLVRMDISHQILCIGQSLNLDQKKLVSIYATCLTRLFPMDLILYFLSNMRKKVQEKIKELLIWFLAID